MKTKEFLEKLRGMSDQKKKIVLWTIIAVLAIIMGFFWIRGVGNTLSNLGNNMGQVQLPNIEAQDTGVSDALNNLMSQVPAETSDWKTYTNEEYKFEIKIPPNWVVNEEYGAGMMFTTEDLLKKEKENSLNCQQKIDCNPEFSPVVVYFRRIEKNADIYTSEDVINGTAQIQLNGINWTRYQPPGFFANIHFRTVDTGMGYDFQVDNDVDEITLKQILSTFKFIPVE